jgi:hypothetical protein
MNREEFNKMTVMQRVKYNLSILTRAYSNADDLSDLLICKSMLWEKYEPGDTIDMHEHILRIKPKINLKLKRSSSQYDALLGKALIRKDGLTSHLVVYEDVEGVMIVTGNGDIRIQRSQLLDNYFIQETVNG